MKDKILSIQNKAKSLRWGCTRHSETETIFVVGHKSYPRQLQFFVVTNDLKVETITEDHRIVPFKSCKNETEVLKVIYGLLKQWFPAKGGVTC